MDELALDPAPDQTAVIRPGQTLVVRYRPFLSVRGAEEFRARIAERLPGVEILVLGGVEQMLVYAPEDDAAMLHARVKQAEELAAEEREQATRWARYLNAARDAVGAADWTSIAPTVTTLRERAEEDAEAIRRVHRALAAADGGGPDRIETVAEIRHALLGTTPDTDPDDARTALERQIGKG